MDEHGRVELGGAGDHGLEVVEVVGSAEPARGQRDPDAPAGEQIVDVVSVRLIERDRPPGSERLTRVLDTGEVSLDQLVGVGARQALHPDRARGRDQYEVEALIPGQARTLRRILGGEIDRIGLLAGAVDDCRPVAAGHERQAVAGGQGVEQGLGPKMLVDVGRGGRGKTGMGRSIQH